MKSTLAGFITRGMALGLAVLSFATVAKASPYASCITNFVVSGVTNVSFYLNEGGGTVTVVTYPSGTTNSLGVLPAGPASFSLGSDSSYTISVAKTGTGTPAQISTDGGINIWNNGMTLRAVGANICAQFGDSFGRVNVAATGTSTTDNGAGGPAFRGTGVYALTPDLQNNAIYGGRSPIPAVNTVQSNTLTFTAIPTNGAIFVMDTNTLTWTTNTVTNTATQVAIDSGGIANNATNLANALNLNLAVHPGTLSVTVQGNVVSMLQFAQATSGASYFSYAFQAAFGPFGSAEFNGQPGPWAGPFAIGVDPLDGSVWVTDATLTGANLYQFGRNFEYTNQIWTATGDTAGPAALEHGLIEDVTMRGSIAGGNLQIWTADSDLNIPTYFNNTNLGTLGNGGVGNFGGAQETIVNDQNEIYRYDIGSGAPGFPVTNTPVWAVTLGLNGANFGGQKTSVAISPNTNFNYVYASFRRLNFSDGNLQVFNAVTGARVYTSLAGTPGSPSDIFAQDSTGTEGCYGLRISPDGRFLAALFADSQVAVVNLTNGIPDPGSIFYVKSAAGNTTSREMCWDAADNLYIPFSTAIERSFTLGLSSTCVTSNDISGTNGSFQLILPPADVTVANAGNASQNYGTPAAGFINVNEGTSSNAAAVTVNFTIGGSATNAVNYNIGVGTINGIVVATNSGNVGTVTFPQGAFGGVGNWNVNIPINPTASPNIGPSLNATITLQAGTTYVKGSPSAATVVISNTGPQFFFISAAPSATTMSRAITNDYAEFIINRWGDLNGPGNALNAVTPKTITLTNFTLKGTAIFPTDYTAGVQPFNPGVPPEDGSASVPFAPGVASQTVLVGNPVSHANALQPSTNVTIIPTLTNSAGTNITSLEGYSYFVNASSTTLTEFDNAQGLLAEVVIWSDPLTNSSGDYAVTFAAGAQANSSVLPVYVPNYQYTNGGAANGSAASYFSPSNLFDVQLGWPITNENNWESSSGVGFFGPAYSPPPSDVMVANGWSNVLRMTVDKNNPSMNSPLQTQCGVNFFPTTNSFVGNYALRFDMYLSIWSGALDNPGPLAFPRQFAAFGINTQGTNCDWRVSIPAGYTGANNPTNADGLWYVIDAGDQSLTPADFDAFASPSLPNNGTSDTYSSTAQGFSGVFKRPPFPKTDGATAGTPINQWVNVSVETHAGTNVSLVVDNTTIFPNLAFTNNAGTAPNVNPVNGATLFPAGLWTNGMPMLGYIQPYPSESDESAFVYYSNVRVVELSPYVTTHPLSYLVLPGASVTFTSAASYASQNLTNTWMRGTTTPAAGLATNTIATTSFLNSGFTYYASSTNDTITISNITTGSNYWAVWSDKAGSVTSEVACVEVVTPPPTNVITTAGTKTSITVPISGEAAPIFQWYTNGVALVNGTKYTNVTTATLSVSNVQAADTIPTYTVTVTDNLTNLIGLFISTNVQTVGPFNTTITIGNGPASATVAPATLTALWGSSPSFTVNVTGGNPTNFTYTWKKNGTKITGATTSTLTLSDITTASAGSYTCGVTNSIGGVLSSAGVLTVSVPPPTFTGITANGTSVTMGFGSTNSNDTTNAFKLLSAPVVTGPYTNNTTATFSTNGGGGFIVTTPQTSTTNMFYILEHNP